MTLVTVASRYLHYNAGAFVSDGEACLVDPGIAPDEIAALTAKLGGAAIRYVVLTHSDWDHVLGPEHLPETTIVAHARFGDGVDRNGIRAVLERFEAHAGISREEPFEPPVPDETFEDETTLQVGALELRLVHGPGHSPNMLTIYENGGATLWAADLLSDVELPSVIHELASYERTLARLAELEIRVLVPGHGTRTDEAAEITRRLDEDRRYLAQLREVVSASVEAGRSLEEAVAATASMTLRRSEDDDEVHRLNAEMAYAELGGDADPMEVGYARAWKQATGT